METNKEAAARIFKEFSFKEGNQHIGSENAIKGILNLIESRKMTSVLEVGTGIGALAYAACEGLIRNSNGNSLGTCYVGLEDNDYCIGEFKNNLSLFLANPLVQFEHYHGLNDIPPVRQFEIIIIDGEDGNLVKALDFLAPHGVVFIEGDRRLQVDTVRKKAKEVGRDCLYFSIIADRRNRPYGPFQQRYMGGFQLFIFEPTVLDYFDWIWTRLTTALKYRTRRYITLFD